MIEVRPILPSEWERFRELRLRALKESPNAFSSTLGAEALLGFEIWKNWVSEKPDRKVMVAERGEEWLGTVSAAPYQGLHDAYNFFALWVDPAVRRSGVGTQLLEAMLAWAKGTQRARARFHVHQANEAALKLLERTGFKDTGERFTLREDLPGDALVFEHTLG
jgi:ribosomal protein S18 acetylase RimI-like enzyme